MGKPKENGGSSPVSSGENSSLLDFDLKNDDFLNSWKPKSGGEANLMDIDFGSPVKSKNKTFGFDKMDMDFNLDSGFGKLSSFNIDMPDLDVSSPKRDGKHKEKSKDGSGKENNKGKADSFDFSFDFMDFNFDSDVKKNKKNVVTEDTENSSKKDHQGARIQLAGEIGELEVGLFEKPTVSGNTSSSNTLNLHGGIDSDSVKEAVPHQSMIKKNGPSENLTAEYVPAASGGRDRDSTNGNVSMKSIGSDDGTLQTPTAENVATSSGVSRTPNGNAQHVDGDPKSTNENISLKSSGTDNGNTKLQTESIMNKTLISTEIQQTDCQAEKTSPGGAITQEVGSSDPLLEHLVHSTSEADIGEHTRMLQEEDIVASITVTGGEQEDNENVTAASGSTNGEVVLESLSQHIANAESQHVIEIHDVNDNMEGLEQVQSNSDLKCPPMKTMSSQMLLGGRINEDPVVNVSMPSTTRTKIDSAIPASEAFITRSKYFSGSSKTASELQKSTLTSSAPKLNSLGRNFLAKPKPSLTAESKSAASISSQVISSSIAQQAERSTSTKSAYAKPLLPTSTIAQQAERSTSTTSANAKPSLPNLIPLTKNAISEPEKVVTTKTVQKSTDLSGIENRRTSKTIDSSMSQKEDKSMGSMGSNKRMLGSMASKISPLATPQQHTLVSLKRKTPEAPDSVEVLVNHPKRHSDSSIGSRRLLETSGSSVDKKDGETLDRHNAKGVITNRHPSPVQILPELNMQNLGSPYSIKDDNYVDKAEACSKELEDISNMLKKKHEEAKDLLVRAIINNNKLLMLNHPLYDEKIWMIQKFAAGLILGK